MKFIYKCIRQYLEKNKISMSMSNTIDIANTISKLTNAKIIVKESNDPRSYRVNSDKILNAGFIPKKCILNAIEEIIKSYHSGVLKDEDKCYTLNWMQIMQNSGNI